MYIKSDVKMMFYEVEKENTAKMVYGSLSDSFKNDQGGYDHEYWNARFVGRCYEKAKTLKNKTVITIKECQIRNYYDKDKKKNHPYIMVFDFD